MNAAIIAAASALGVEPAAFGAIVAVESSGTGLNPDGRPLIRVEAHLLWKYNHLAADRFHVSGPHPWEGHEFDGRPYHGDQGREWTAYGVASAIDPDAAMRATSWGCGQVLGNYERLGYGSGLAGRSAFGVGQSTTGGQVDAMRRFIQADATLLAALRGKDWMATAGRYNGRGNMVEYAGRLQRAYAAS